MQTKRSLTVLPMPSTSFRHEVGFAAPEDGQAQILFEVERGGAWFATGLQFDGACAFSHRTESRCTEWYVDGIYDRLVEVVNSAWVAELNSVYVSHFAVPGRTPTQVHHYMIYLDSVGAFEVVAESWSWLSEEPVD